MTVSQPRLKVTLYNQIPWIGPATFTIYLLKGLYWILIQLLYTNNLKKWVIKASKLLRVIKSGQTWKCHGNQAIFRHFLRFKSQKKELLTKSIPLSNAWVNKYWLYGVLDENRKYLSWKIGLKVLSVEICFLCILLFYPDNDFHLILGFNISIQTMVFTLNQDSRKGYLHRQWFSP